MDSILSPCSDRIDITPSGGSRRQAAIAAVQSLQYSNRIRGTPILSHEEELAMIAEIRAFLTCVRTQKNDTTSSNTIVERLLDLGNTILEPLLLNPLRANTKTQRMIDFDKTEIRQNSYLLPLEFIPAILSMLDALENGAAIRKSGEFKHEAKGTASLYGSDRLLSSMFAYKGCVVSDCICKTLHRAMRADALLPLLSLAMDDIGFSRASTSLSVHEGATYWDCLKFAANDVIRSNLMCYSADIGFDGAMGDVRQQIFMEARDDEGAHIIPLSDYPGLMRCMFRMVATCPTSNKSWARLLLRLYHAAAVATNETPAILNSMSPLSSFHRKKKLREVDRQVTLSMVEGHVLLPSCTEASVSTIKSILEACIQECCPLCKQDVYSEIFLYSALHQQVCTHDNDTVPSWAIAGVALLIMRARASTHSQSGTATNFGPRAVFRMASGIMRKSAQNKKPNNIYAGDDEVGYALNVLLHLSDVQEGSCRACRNGRPDEDVERSAYDALKCSYYTRNRQFAHRYSGATNGVNTSYRCQLGFHTLYSYSTLIRASLNHGALHHTGKIQSSDSFIAYTGQTWIDAANMLLEGSHSSNGKACSRIPDGTAMAIVIITVIFFEIPSSQGDIVRSIYGRIKNMASRNSHSIERQGEESCFVLVSMLAWSLCMSDGKSTSSEVVQKTGCKEERDHGTSVLRPLCSLLTKWALPQDHHLYDSHLYRALRHLAHALSPVPSGREVILGMAQKNMSVLSNSFCTQSSSIILQIFGLSPSTTSTTNDAIYLAIDFLCVLIEKYHTSNDSLDDCGRTALGIITDIIVLRRPSSSSTSQATSYVSIEAISWMLRKLDKSARFNKLTKWASHRLLRSCFVGLLKFVQLWPADSMMEFCPIFPPENVFSKDFSLSIASTKEPNKDSNGGVSLIQSFRMKNDVPGMLQLAVSLQDELAKSDKTIYTGMAQASMESHILLKHQLLRTLQPQNAIEHDASVEIRMSQLFKGCQDALQRGFNPRDRSISIGIDDLLLMIFIDGAARMIQNTYHSSPRMLESSCASHLSVACRAEEDWGIIYEYIQHAERYFYLQAGSALPNWIEAHHHHIDANNRCRKVITQVHQALMKSVDFHLLHMSLCDIVVEMLLRGWTHYGVVQVGNNPHELSLLMSVHSILGSKHTANELGTPSSTNENLPFWGGMPSNSICSLFELSSQHIRSLLVISEDKKHEDTLAQVDMLIKNVLHLCKFIQTNTKQRSRAVSSQRILSSFWALYCALADDESSQSLSSFVKESYVKMGNWAGLETKYDIETSFSLLFITSSEDLDYHVRYLRGVFLLTLSQVLTISQSESSLDEQKAGLDILLQLLLQICQDLDAGFQGYSGGLTQKLLLLFLSVIDKCIDAMTTLFDLMPSGVQYQIWSSFVSVHQAAVIIWGIFLDHSLQKASIIKGMLRLCIDKMPNMIRRVERVLDLCVVDKPLCGHTCELLDHCSTSLKSKWITRQTEENDSQRGAVTVPVVSDGTKTSDDEDIIISSKENSLEGRVAEEECRVSMQMDADIRRAQMPNVSTAETLPWAYNCAFVALTNVWNESHRVITGLNAHRMKKCIFFPTDIGLRRIKEFSNLLTSMCLMFEEGQKKGARGELGSTKILAETLSYYGKSNICTCVEKISRTLILSAKQLVKHLRACTPQAIGKPPSSYCAKLNESIVCLVGWLYSVKTKQTKYDLITGPLQWYINEKSGFGKSDNEGYPILGRLPKVLFRLEGLEVQIRMLDVVLTELSQRDDDITKNQIMVLNQMTTAITKDKNGLEEKNSFSEMLRQCLENVDSYKSAMKISEINGSFTSDEGDSDVNLERDDVPRTRKRTRQWYPPIWKSNRVSLRSKNATIDNWLAMDDNEFGSAPGEKHNVNDAFVDLEDFLVDG